MKITETENGHNVESTSGKNYIVAYCGSGDGDPDYIATWECNCPSYKYGSGICKHIKAVIENIEETDNES